MTTGSKSNVRHVLSLSGGKDSTALALFMRDRVPEMEYVFCDTGKELPETYEYLKFIESYLGRPIVRLSADRGFDHWLQVYGGYLPSVRMRWCTKMLKIRPFEDYVGEDPIQSYIGIRADEDRGGYISHKPNITAVYPFKEAGIIESDVYRILHDSGIGLPRYYEWRSRSGCYFCFFQQKVEWVGLLQNHPDLFEQAKAYEKVDLSIGKSYTWCDRESLEELSDPARVVQILKKHNKRIEREKLCAPNQTLFQIFSKVMIEDDCEQSCLICSL